MLFIKNIVIGLHSPTDKLLLLYKSINSSIIERRKRMSGIMVNNEASVFTGDERVRDAQEWLNDTYSGKTGYSPIEEDGIIGAGTVKALIIALQIEEGETNPDGIFGNNTKAKCPELSEGYVDASHNFCRILQHGLFCKGYSPLMVSGVFGPNTKSAVQEIQENAGIEQTGVVDGKLMKQILSLDSLVNKGDAKLREIQQALNGAYLEYFDIIPTDGLPSRGLAKGLIYALQAEEGLSPSQANGNFGPTTTAKCPTLSVGDSRSPFVKILQYALYINGENITSFDGIFGAEVQKAVSHFQRFASLPVSTYGTADVMTWMSLLTSKGDVDRRAYTCDMSTTITSAIFSTLKQNGYTCFGRYLTGKYAMSKEEIALILGENEGLGEDETKYRIFLIFQRTGGAVPSNKIEYFTEAQAVQDAKEAVEAALNFGFKQGAFIFFASDVDAYDYQVKEILLPYFKKVKETFDQYNTRHFQMGLYGPRNTCIQVCDAGYAAGCFVSDVSSGYSGNLGYPFPKSWIFDQFHTTTLGEGTDGEIEIDKVAASGYYIGESELIDYENPVQNEKLEQAIRIAVPIIAQFETNHGLDLSEAYSTVIGNFDGQGISFGILQYNFGQETLQPILNSMITEYPEDMEQIFGNGYNVLVNHLQGSKAELISWADSISDPESHQLQEEWKSRFEDLGGHPYCQKLQQDAMESYWKRAINPICKNYGLKTCRGFVMAFNIAVNEWSLGDEAYNEIMGQFTDGMTEVQKLQIIAKYGSNLARKQAIADGHGIVNGIEVDLDGDFGLNDEVIFE